MKLRPATSRRRTARFTLAGAGLTFLAALLLAACSDNLDAPEPAAAPSSAPKAPAAPNTPPSPDDSASPAPGPGGEPPPERDRNGNVIPPTGW